MDLSFVSLILYFPPGKTCLERKLYYTILSLLLLLASRLSKSMNSVATKRNHKIQLMVHKAAVSIKTATQLSLVFFKINPVTKTPIIPVE